MARPSQSAETSRRAPSAANGCELPPYRGWPTRGASRDEALLRFRQARLRGHVDWVCWAREAVDILPARPERSPLLSREAKRGWCPNYGVANMTRVVWPASRAARPASAPCELRGLCQQAEPKAPSSPVQTKAEEHFKLQCRADIAEPCTPPKPHPKPDDAPADVTATTFATILIQASPVEESLVAAHRSWALLRAAFLAGAASTPLQSAEIQEDRRATPGVTDGEGLAAEMEVSARRLSVQLAHAKRRTEQALEALAKRALPAPKLLAAGPRKEPDMRGWVRG